MEPYASFFNNTFTQHPWLWLGAAYVLIFHNDLVRNALTWITSQVFKQSVPGITPTTLTTPTSVAASLDALRSLTEWAVHNGTTETLCKVTELYKDLQNKAQGGK